MEFNFKIDSSVFDILVSRLRADHFEYFKNSLGLSFKINFKGYEYPVKASIPYKDDPVEFYKWWCNNTDQVSMKFQEKIILFDKVFFINPKLLKLEHKKLINK